MPPTGIAPGRDLRAVAPHGQGRCNGTYSTVCQGPWARSAAHRKYVSGSLPATRGTARPWGHSLVESHVALGGLNSHAAQVSNPSTMHWHRSRCHPQE